MYDRILAGILLVLSGLIVWSALQFDVPFQYEPLGPKAFPIILSILLSIVSVWLIIKPDANNWHPTADIMKKLFAGLVLMVVYAALFKGAGFILATFIVGGAFSWLFGETPKRAALFALVMSVISYFLLTSLLQLNVPSGTWWAGVF
ncbi:tripartite tricarboxylate transporter TctB family protein [Amphritea sp. ZJ14W]|uniref:Tripartite tricarboxylate transporter TctB family protein n=2 Tax=Amphritea pacifica TaxID=2811233 RepID=A0ABS2W5I1_9GAMM|nr:tripartite tricarboxylate transporter TctB family protein [Amphritea pacifica]MBN0986788.1 tripartite tricarboxylate transporter TctB family protein [Amphritea pacifica]MBN1005229.1 tripartite tricarboxylate transporter TctB family protein [Amphritea pacifica]